MHVCEICSKLNARYVTIKLNEPLQNEVHTKQNIFKEKTNLKYQITVVIFW